MYSSKIIKDKLEEYLIKKGLGLPVVENGYQPLCYRYNIWIHDDSFHIWSVDKSKVVYYGLISDQINT